MREKIIISEKPDIIWLNKFEIFNRINSNHFRSYMIKNDENIKSSNLNMMKIKDIVDKNRRGKGFGAICRGDIVNYKVRNLTNYGIDHDADTIGNELYKKNKLAHILRGDVLLASTGVGSLGKVDLFCGDFDATADGHITILTAKNGFDGGYLKSYLQCEFGQILIEQNTLGSTGQTELYPKDIGEMIIPIPSPEIQKYIGDKVRRAEELREEAKRLKEEAEDIVDKAIDIDNLTEKVRKYTVKNKWVNSSKIEGRVDGQYYTSPIIEINKDMAKVNADICTLKEVAKVGKGFSFSDEDNLEGVPYVRISDLDDLLIDYSKIVKTDYKTYQQKVNAQLKEYDLVMAITGATIGKVSMFYGKEVEKSTLSADTAYVRFKNPIDSVACLLYLKTIIGQIAITQGITGATNKHLAMEDIRNIGLPKFEENIKEMVKNKIINSIDNIYTSKQLIQEAKQDVEDLIEGNFDMSKLNNATQEQ